MISYIHFGRVIGNRKKIGDSDTSFIFIIKPDKSKLVFDLSTEHQKNYKSVTLIFLHTFCLNVFFNKISCLQRFPERERPWLWERPNPKYFLQKYSQKSYATRGRVQCRPAQTQKKKKRWKRLSTQIIFLSSTRTYSCFDDIWYTLHMVTYDHSLLEPSQKKGGEMTNCNSSTFYEATPSACLHMGYTFNRK